MKKNNLLLVICTLVSMIYVVADNSFIVPKKKKKVTKGKLQEKCCQQVHHHLETIPQLTKELADIQLDDLQQLTEYVEGSNCLLKDGSKQQLREYHAQLSQLTEALDSVLDQVRAYNKLCKATQQTRS